MKLSRVIAIIVSILVTAAGILVVLNQNSDIKRLETKNAALEGKLVDATSDLRNLSKAVNDLVVAEEKLNAINKGLAKCREK